MEPYIGLWHGGKDRAEPNWEDHAEWFDSQWHALSVFSYRRHNLTTLPTDTHKVDWGAESLGEHTTPRKDEPLSTNDPNYYFISDESATLLLVPADQTSLEVLQRYGIDACSHLLSINQQSGNTQLTLF